MSAPHPVRHLDDLADQPILVRCPSCAGPARSARHTTDEPGTGRRVRSYRLTCTGCGYARSDRTGPVVFGGARDPFFGADLWLQRAVAGHRLWAYHEAHLDELAHFVADPVRARPGGDDGPALVERLPAWMTDAHRRDEVLRAIQELRATLPR